jgi:4-hydroxybutyrate CoA-transferase
LDFARSANLGGRKSIIAITSTFGKNNVSKIGPFFEKGDIISLTRYDVDYVDTEYGIRNTEYGIAELRHSQGEPSAGRTVMTTE